MPFVPRKRVLRELEHFEKERSSFTKRELKRVTKPLTGEFRERAVGKVVTRKEFREAVRHAADEQKIRQADTSRLFTRWRKWFRPEPTPPHATEESKGHVKGRGEEREGGYGVPTAEPFRAHVTGAEDRQFATGGTPVGGVSPELRHVPDSEARNRGDAERRLAKEEGALQESSAPQGSDDAAQVSMSPPEGVHGGRPQQNTRENFLAADGSVTPEAKVLESTPQENFSRKPFMNPVQQVRESLTGKEGEQSGQKEEALAPPMMPEVSGQKEAEITNGVEQEHNVLQKVREQREAGAIPSGGLYARKEELSQIVASGITPSPQREAEIRKVLQQMRQTNVMEAQHFWKRAAWWGFLLIGAVLWFRELVVFSRWWGILGTFVAAVLGPVLFPVFPFIEWGVARTFPIFDFFLTVITVGFLWYGREEGQRFRRHLFGRSAARNAQNVAISSTGKTNSGSINPEGR